MSHRWLLAGLLVLARPLAAQLVVGDVLPDVSKVPLVAVTAEYEPEATDVPSLEDLLEPDGVLLLHFMAPRPRPGAPFPPIVLEEQAALAKAALSAPYRCRAVAVIPFGTKGRDDFRVLQAMLGAQEQPPWSRGVRTCWEPTYPYPGLYRAFRPTGPIETPLTAVIGPDRAILALRAANEGGPLYDWLVEHLPAALPAAVGQPTADLDLLDPAAAWPSFRRDVRRAAAAPLMPDRLPTFYLAWQTSVGRTFASPVTAGDLAYLSTDEDGVSAVQLRTGQARPVASGGTAWWSTPVLAGDLLIGVRDRALTAIDRRNLQPVWSQPLDSLVTSSPTVADGRLFVGLRRGTVRAFDVATGAPLWSYATGGEISSSPAVADGLLLIGSGDRRLYALDAADGAPRWSLETGAPVDSTPTVAGDTAYVGSFDGCLYAVALADGAVRWKCPLGGWVHSSPAVHGDLVFVGTVPVKADQIAQVAWVDRGSGAVRASFRMPAAVYSSPTAWGELMLVGCRDYQVYAFDATGRRTQPVWTFRTRSYVHASPVVAGDTVLIASFDGFLYALRQDKPIGQWTADDPAPRWFMAALTRALHQGTEQLVARAAGGPVDAALELPRFDELFAAVRGEVLGATPAARVLPRDVPPDHPGAAFVEYALTAGLLGGFPDGTFQPSQPSTRYQFSSGLNAVLANVARPDFAWRALRAAGAGERQVEVRLEESADRPPAEAADVDPGHWAAEALAELGRRGLLPLDDEGRFRGERTVTLADAEVQWNLIAAALRVTRTR